MVLLALPRADHLLIERDRGQFVRSRRRRMMANVRAERLLKIPAEPSPELRIIPDDDAGAHVGIQQVGLHELLLPGHALEIPWNAPSRPP